MKWRCGETAWVAAALVLAAALGCSAAAAAEVAAFASGPTAMPDKGGVRIEFTVKQPTDAAVEVVDGAGTIVRHLAAGVLGDKAPEPFQKGTLAQSLRWDREDDCFKPVAGPCAIRVRLGLRATFDRFLGRDDGPNLAEWMTVGIAVDRDGTVFVLMNDAHWTQCQSRVCVFSREGRYLRTILPPPASLAAEKLPGVDMLCADPACRVPRIYCHLCGHIVPQTRGLRPQTPVVTADGRLIMANGYAGENFGWGPRCLLAINRDGSLPRPRIDGPFLAPGCASGSLSIALSPDEKWAYVAGLHDGRYAFAKDAHQVVYKVGLGLDDKPIVFAGQLKKAGNDEAHLNLPCGLATDPDGNVYVADNGNDRIVVYNAQGGFLSQIKLVSPDYLAVDPRTRAIYVLAGSRERKVPGRIVKLSGFRDPRQVWAWDQRVPADAVLGLDPYADKPIIYFGSPRPPYDTHLCVQRMVDLGETCTAPSLLPGLRGGGGLAFYPHICGVRDDALYVKDHGRSWVLQGAAGERQRFWAGYYDKLFLGLDGYAYLARPGVGWLKPGAIERVDLAKHAVPFAATGPRSAPYYYFWLGRKSDIWATPKGDIYFLELGSEPEQKHFGNDGQAVVSVIGPDGKLKTRGLIATLLAPVGVRVDGRGCIYVADNLKPLGRRYPDEIAAFVARAKDGEGLGPEAEYAALYGSILKFPPEGGTIRELRQGEAAPEGTTALEEWLGRRRFAVKGLLACYPGISPLPPNRSALSNCFCNAASFDLDRHGRLFVPDVARFRVHVLDADFNPILHFGSYDNIDSKGGEANAPGPPIPLAAFRGIEVVASDEACYVLDPSNQRIVRVKLSYAAEATCPLP